MAKFSPLLKLRLAFLCTLSMLSLACSQAPVDKGQGPIDQPATPAKTHFSPGEITPQVALAAHPKLGYALYLPKDYRESRSYPLMLAFDSHARGQLPLEMYRSLADRHGWILAGSNDSRNGMPPEEAKRIARLSLDDLKSRFAIDENQVYLTGFSGGARVAALVAGQERGIAGVIGCAAGFQPQPSGQAFAYYGLVGHEDFNYLEFKSLETALEAMKFANEIAYFRGGHAWAPVEEMAVAMHWMEFRAMAEGRKSRDEAAIASQRHALTEEYQQIKGPTADFRRWKLWRKKVSWLSGLEDVESLREEMQSFRATSSFALGQKLENELAQKELDLRKELLHDLQIQSVPWWKNKSTELMNSESPSAWVNQRVLSFLSLNCYSFSNQFLQRNDLVNADKFLKIYALVDPLNSEYAYLTAHLRMKQGKSEEAWPAIEKALGLGFGDWKRFENDPVLVSLQGDPRFQELKNKMKDQDKSTFD